MNKAEAKRKLEGLLLSLPTPTLWHWLTRTCPELEQEVAWENAARAERVRAAVDWLSGAGLIDSAFFSGLANAFAGRDGDVRDVEAGWEAAWRPPAVERPTSPELEAALVELAAVKAQRKQLVLDGESVVPLDAELERLETEVGRLRFIAAIGALRRPAPSSKPFTAGFVLAGRYELVEVVGRGGFARVWKAYDQEAEQVVAVKVLREDLTDERGRVERFLLGAREMAKLDHPAIVKVVGEPGEVEGRPWFAMEFLRGGDLAQAFAAGRLTWETALPCLLQVGEALQYAHKHRLLHRDVKPENILLDRGGQAKLTDFDLVRVEETAERSRTKTIGTFLYAAPETLRGERAPDVRVDVYGLGMTALFAHCEGAPPVDELMFDRSGFFGRLACLDSLKKLFEKALAYRVDARFESVQALCSALREVAPTPRPAVEDEAPAPHQPRRPTSPFRLSLVEIPAGRFWMGSTPEERERFGYQRGDDESPRHEMEITRPLQMLATPVTQALYEAVPGENPSHFKGAPQRPVEQVSWFDAVRFCNELSAAEGLPLVYSIQGQTVTQDMRATGFRLPSEAEWEYACRAGTSTAFWSGDGESDLAEVGWYYSNSRRRTHAVGAKPANPWGLYDMHGNVWEWCQDRYNSSYYASSPGKNPPGPAARGSSYRVIRGGSYHSGARGARAAYRSSGVPGLRNRSVGFRVVVAVPQAVDPGS